MPTAPLCQTCGTQFAPSEELPSACPICEDERQYVPAGGQAWTTLDRIRESHSATFRREGEFLGIGTAPQFAIGQRALLVRTPQGNILWDCVAMIDDATVEIVEALGGLAGIAISHPHYYTTMVEWSRAFGGAPIHLHAADRQWVMRPDPAIAFWGGDRKDLLPGLTLVNCGGHFAGGTVLHVADAAGGKGALLTGDILQVTADRSHVAFLRSYPNYLPLGEALVRKVVGALEELAYETVYGAFWGRVIASNGRDAVARSAGRHIAWLHRDDDR